LDHGHILHPVHLRQQQPLVPVVVEQQVVAAVEEQIFEELELLVEQFFEELEQEQFSVELELAAVGEQISVELEQTVVGSQTVVEAAVGQSWW